MTFGGQGADWFATLTELAGERADTCSPGVSGRGVRSSSGSPWPASWPPRSRVRSSRRRGSIRTGTPQRADTSGAALGMPGVLLTQLATMDLLAAEGMDLTRIAPVAWLATPRESSVSPPSQDAGAT